MTRNICFCSSQYSTSALRSLQEKFPNVTFEIELLFELRNRGIANLIKGFHSYARVCFYTYDLTIAGRSLLWTMILLWLSREEAYLLDMQGRVEKIGYGFLCFRSLPHFFLQLLELPVTLLKIKQNIRQIARKAKKNNSSIKVPVLMKNGERIKLAYLRTDHWFGIKAGGSVGHIAGVANGFADTVARVFVISTDNLGPINSSGIPVYIIKPDSKYTFLAEVPQLYHNIKFIKEAHTILEKEKPNLIYQRYSHNNYSGVVLAREFNLPFVVEYNGSEVWVARNWGHPLRFEKTTNKIELLNLRAADLIVVVSKALKKELFDRGIEENKILVNPNGVDPQQYRPDIDGSSLRQYYRLEEKTVLGFIGTFGRWHGAEVMARAVVRLIQESTSPEQAHFLFIGDGLMLPETRRIIQEGGVGSKVTFTGLVPQEQGPEYLAACDILVSPHVPNPDGTPFFGSPTKLFEYMAVGKGIVASNLDQIGEVLEHGKTAWLVEPGNTDELAEGMLTLIKDEKLRELLGQNARIEVTEKYTWDKHVRRTMARLTEILES